MNRPAIGFAIGVAVFLLWYFVALTVLWPRDGLSIALGVSLALNAALVFWVATESRRSNSPADTATLRDRTVQ